MNYTLKELTSLSFDDWATLIQAEETGGEIEVNQKIYEILVAREIYFGLTSLFEHPICNFSTV